MRTKKIILSITAIISLLLIVVVAYLRVSSPIVEETLSITDFESCKDAGYPIMESHPEQCRTPDGTLFVRTLEPVTKDPVPLPPDKNPNPAPAPTPSPATLEFNAPATYKIGDTQTYVDGLTVTLKEIKDSRCKDGVQCIWEGELSPLFSATSGAIGTTSSSVAFATVHHPYPVILPRYIFTMTGTTDIDTTISVWKSTTTLNKYGATSLPLSSEVKSCTVDADCALFAPECSFEAGYACELTPVNKSFKDDLKLQKAAFCTANPSPTTGGCESEWDQKIELKCVHRVCQFSE